MEDGGAGEGRDERVDRRGDEVGRGAGLEDPAVDDDADRVRERSGIFEVVRDEDRRQSEVAQVVVELTAHRGLGVRVERRERLVEEEHAGLAREGSSESDALALAARQLARSYARRGGAMPKRSSISLTSFLLAAPNPTFAETSRCGKSAYSWNR